MYPLAVTFSGQVPPGKGFCPVSPRRGSGTAMSGIGEQPKTVLYLLGGSALDRLAYRHLLHNELQRDTVVDSGFTPTGVWTAMRMRPDVVLVDSDHPTPEVLDAVQMIVRLQPEARVVVISAAVEPHQLESWGRCPLHGYVVKDGGIEELRAALVAVVAGRQYFSAGTRGALDRGAARVSGTLLLSRREAELLPLLARGMTLRDAARQMSVSYKTADSYRTSLLRKLGVHDRVELARFAIRERIIDP